MVKYNFEIRREINNLKTKTISLIKGENDINIYANDELIAWFTLNGKFIVCSKESLKRKGFELEVYE